MSQFIMNILHDLAKQTKDYALIAVPVFLVIYVVYAKVT